MRSATAGELTTLDATTRAERLRVKVANGSGTMIDLSSWVEAYSIDHDVDQPVGGASVSFTRANDPLQSLAPLRTDSTLNVNDAAAYAPLLDLNRAITIEVSTADIGAAVNYKMMFEGTIDIVNWESSPVVVSCRDGMAPLVDRWIEESAFFGTTPVGTQLEDVMEDIADAIFGVGVEPVYTPVSPAYAVIRYQQQEMSVMDSWTDLIQLRGMDIREKWHDGTSAFRHTLYEPDRAKTTPDHTFTPSKYFTISQLSLELTNIRNAIQVTFRDSADLGNRNRVNVSNGPSITKYKRRFFRMQESDTSPINTSAEAITMANAALADLKDPKAEQEVEMPFFWPAEIGDLYRYPDNRVHYNTNQDWAVVEIKHTFEAGSPPRFRTVIKTRGTPIGQYATWLGRGGTIGGGVNGQAFAPYPFIVPLNTEANDSQWDLRFNAVAGSGGGGTNIEYTIKSKKTFGTEATLVGPASGSALPDDVTITRDPKQGQVITFRVTDAATGMFAEAHFTVPAFVAAISATGTVIGAQIDAATVGPTQTYSRLRCKTIRTSNQSISDSTPTNIVFNGSDLWDVGDLHSLVSNADRLVVPTGGDTGVWAIDATVRFDANATGRREVRIWQMPVGGGPGSISAEEVRPGLSDGGVGNTISIHATGQPAAVGDFWIVEVWQNSTAALNLTGVQTAAATHSW